MLPTAVWKVMGRVQEQGIKPLPHFKNPLHTFAMQYKLSVQGNIETVCLLSKKP